MLGAAWLGAILFFSSLSYFAYFYLVRLATPPAHAAEDASRAIAVNIALFSAFALHHSLFARTGIKTAVARILPPAFERSAYVWLASLLFLAVCLLWQPVPGVAWEATGALRLLLFGAQFAGTVLTLHSASRLDIWDLAGIRQVRAARAASSRSSLAAKGSDGNTATNAVPLEVNGPYRWLRHPIYLGWLLLVFGAPTMTAARLLFALISSAYLVVAIPIEERALLKEFGPSYRDYQRRVRWRMVPGVW
jgi:protein-S-isoprenylcysteine O-methyltransferase Ste14